MSATVPLNSILQFLPLKNMAKLKIAHGNNYNNIFNPILAKRKQALNKFSKIKIPLKLKKIARDQRWKTNHPNGYVRNNYKFYKNILGSIRQVPLNTNTKKAIMNAVLKNMKPHPKNYNIYNAAPNRNIANYNLKIGNNIVRAGLQRNYMSGYRAAYVNIYKKQPNNTYILHHVIRANNPYNINNLIYDPTITGTVS